MQAQTIRIFLPEGHPMGLRIADISGKLIQAFVFSRKNLKAMAERGELNNTGVYFLFGQEPDQELPSVYIGEAESIYPRLTQHNKDDSKDFWTDTVCFVTKDNSLTKAHVKFLEFNAYRIAREMKRCHLANGSIPASVQLPEMDAADAENFLIEMKIILSSLGWNILLHPQQSEQSEDVTYSYSKGSVNAKGKYLSEGFLIYKGSTVEAKTQKSAGAWVQSLKDELLKSGVLQDGLNQTLELTQDYLFKSPSAAGAIVRGGNVNGWTFWKDSYGKTLDENERQ